MPQVSKIPFKQLPKAVRFFVEDILAHRASIRFNLIVVVPTHFLISSLIFHANKKVLFSVYGAVTALNLLLLSAHKEEYTKEELNLFRALTYSKNSNVRKLISSFKYVAVDRKGNLVGKNHAPKIWFVPIGRRRIPTKKGPKRLNRKRKLWEKMQRTRK